MLGIPKHEEEAPPPPQPQRPLSPMGEACSRTDLTAIHQILVNTHYRDDEGSNEVKDRSISVAVCCLLYGVLLSLSNKMVPLSQLSFQEWTQQMRDMLEARKRGDFAFRDKDFKAAIDCYTQVPSS
jgi:BR-signaling kinase